jgi:polygalacturonase
LKRVFAGVAFFLLFSAAVFGAIIDITSAPYNASTASADNAAAIQAAISAAASGDTVMVPAGTFLSGPITLKSNLNLEIASGAILRMLPYGSFPNTSDFIYGKNLSNISITGSGMLDGQGAAWWAAYNANNTISRPPAMIYLSSCTGVTLTGIAVQDSPMFHIQLLGSMSNVYASGLSITAAWPSPNTDGIDLRGTNITIENCYISDGDDVIQLGGSDTVSNVTIRNCAFGTGHGLSIGGYTQGGISGLLVDNCTFTGTQYGLRWKSGRDRGGIITNLTYSNITMTGILLYPFFLTSFYPNPSSLPPTTDNWVTPTATTPYWSNITLKNITASTAASGAKSPGIMWAAAEAPMTNILLDNVQVTGPNGVNFEFHHARGVTITCTCRVDGKQPPLDVGGFDADIYYPACASSTSTPTYSAASVTPTFTKSRTPTSTGTRTPVITNTFTPTITVTLINTATNTFTSTSTPAHTHTFTQTPTLSQTASFTATPYSTASTTAANTPVVTRTITTTPQFTATFSVTVTASPTQTVNAVPSLTETLTPSASKTQMATAIPSFSETLTSTPADTATQSRTATPSATVTLLPASTATDTPTPTGTATQSRTATPSVTVTPEPTLTQTNTAFSLPVITVTPTLTYTPGAGYGVFKISIAIIYPNPYSAGTGGLNFSADITGSASNVSVRIYTASFRRVFEKKYSGFFLDKNIFNIPNYDIKNLASGVYYISLTARSTDGSAAAAQIKPFIIIR